MEKTEKDNFLSKDMKKAMLKVRLLMRISRARVNSYTLLKEMERSKHSKRLFESRAEMKNEIYNTINSLESSGYIKSLQKIENSRLKNYYTLTKKGEDIRRSAREIFRRNVKELASLIGE